MAEARVDLRLQREHMRIQFMEKRLHDLKKGLEDRQSNEDHIVDQEFEAMSTSDPSHTPPPQP